MRAALPFALFYVAWALCVTLPACVSALGELPPLAELAEGGRRHPPADVDRLLAEADALAARRDLESVRRAAKIFLQAAAADATRAEGLVAAARTQVWLADHESGPEQRQRAATAAVQAARWCGRIAPAFPACTYWLGAALGVQARERPSTGLSALPEIEKAFLSAAEQDPTLDEAGPDRALALFYVRAPGWPGGPGDPERGLEHARKAVDLRHDHPPNHLALAEALAATGDDENSRGAYRHALELARSRAAIDPDAAEWIREAEEALRRRPGG